MNPLSPNPPIRPHSARDGRDPADDEATLARLGDELTPAAGTVDRLVARALAAEPQAAARSQRSPLTLQRLLIGLSPAAAALALAVAIWWVHRPERVTPAPSATVAVGDLVVHIDPVGVSTIHSERREAPTTASSGLLIALTWIQPSQQP